MIIIDWVDQYYWVFYLVMVSFCIWVLMGDD